MEHLDNIRFHCPVHGPMPDHLLGQSKDPRSFVGHFVKRAFPVYDGQGRETREHMWVKIEHWDADDKKLYGKLDNIPHFLTTLQCGDPVTVTLDEIEGYLD